ncbi:MAG: flap endonuclease-1 [Candidatus Nanoarchaeia archaeon]|nr:flap endonuclease-1 [Candidatus Nanoarchaeia archaeon]MDD5587794.1 flap endonuclease-1 [Candidatus Nanoarchaeia archaeon]
MGVKLGDLVLRQDITFDELKGKVIAIDASNVIYQFLSSIRQQDGTPLMDSKGNVTSHLVGLFSRTCNLMEKGLKICYVFDGKPPLLKLNTNTLRAARKELAQEKYEKAKAEDNVEEMSKYSKQNIKINAKIIEEAKELITYLGLPVIQAPSEAEAQASFMCEQGDVYGVGSQDFDSLLFNAPRLIQNLTLSNKRRLPGGSFIWIKPQVINLKENLKHLEINQDQLIVMCILCGTDYNPGGVKGIGPKTALKLVQQHKDFDEIFKEVKADFNWKEIYATFKSMPIMKNYQLKWKDIDEYKLKKLLIDEHEFSEERINNTLNKLKFVKKEKEQKDLDKWFK